MEIFALKFQVFSVFFARLLAMFSTAPAYSSESFGFFMRVALSFLIATMVTPVIPMPPDFYANMETRYFSILIEQAIVGIFIGFAVTLVFTAFQMAGEFFSVQMGFGISEVFDPMSQISLPLLGTIKNLMAMYVFFISGSHLHLISAVTYSFEKIPMLPGTFFLSGNIHQGLFDFLALLSGLMFLIALQIAMPVMGTLILVSVALGILSKAAPQMNILMLGFPAKILIGFIVLGMTSPLIIHLMYSQLDGVFQYLDTVIDKWPKPNAQ